MSINKNKDLDFLIGLKKEELESFVESLGEKKFRGRQIFDWIYNQKIDNVTLMTDLPKPFREKLKTFSIHPLKLINNNFSNSKKTRKFLFQLVNGEKIESVLMKEGKRVTICLSTQVGCAVDCKFCATAKMGFKKNLTVGQIVDQFIQLQMKIDQKITNVVFMGMGEPFLNYKNTIEAANLLHHPKGINLGAKRITISTAGIVPKIEQYTKELHPFKLAISLNGTSNEQRLKIMPLTKVYPYKNLLKVAKNYAYNSRNKLTIEYVLLNDINDKIEDAQKLITLLERVNCKLNIIPYNEIGGQFERPSDQKIEKFIKVLKNVNFPVTIRWSKGVDIDAGCGQLVTNI
tara:strand:- start:1610 stop:2647 length:1038 start_codon:yes stop_codon:yes gene_type:complete